MLYWESDRTLTFFKLLQRIPIIRAGIVNELLIHCGCKKLSGKYITDDDVTCHLNGDSICSSCNIL